MSTVRVLVILLICIVPSSFSSATDCKENISPNVPLKDFSKAGFIVNKPYQEMQIAEDKKTIIDEITAKVHKAHKDFNLYGLKEAYQEFLNISDDVFNNHQIDNTSHHHSQASKKDIIGRDIFFPKDTEVWFDCPYRRLRLENPTIIYSLAVATTFQHPLAQLFLAYALDKTEYSHLPDSSQELSEFIENIYDQAVDKLKALDTKHPDRASADYLLGKLYSRGFVTNRFIRTDNFKKALNYHNSHSDIRNRFAAFDVSYQTRFGPKERDQNYLEEMKKFINEEKLEQALFYRLKDFSYPDQLTFLEQHILDFPILNLELGNRYIARDLNKALDYFYKVENLYPYEVSYLSYEAKKAAAENVEWSHFLTQTLREEIDDLIKASH